MGRQGDESDHIALAARDDRARRVELDLHREPRQPAVGDAVRGRQRRVAGEGGQAAGADADDARRHALRVPGRGDRDAQRQRGEQPRGREREREREREEGVGHRRGVQGRRDDQLLEEEPRAVRRRQGPGAARPRAGRRRHEGPGPRPDPHAVDGGDGAERRVLRPGREALDARHGRLRDGQRGGAAKGRSKR